MVTENTLKKLRVLGGQSFDDREGPPRAGFPRKFAGSDAPGVFPVVLPKGRVMPLLSTMMTNACSYDCRYCPMRASREMPRYAFSPEELAGAFMALRRARRAEGLFLTSGIPGSGVTGVDRMIAAAEILRKKHGFRGYIHLKMLPGAEDSQLDRAARLATRLSVNLESATRDGLAAIAPEKDLGGDLLPALRRIGGIARRGREERRPGGPLPGGVTTQFIVGASGESDAQLLGVSHSLQREGLLRHAHFSAFVPVRETAMEGLPAAPHLRERRLYQAEHLLREYGFSLDEIPVDGAGRLDLAANPKLAWARANPAFFPVEITRAGYEELLRVPGVGPVWARRLVEARGSANFRDFRDFRSFGSLRRSAAGWLALRGKRLAPKAAAATQIPLLLSSGKKRGDGAARRNLPPCAFR